MARGVHISTACASLHNRRPSARIDAFSRRCYAALDTAACGNTGLTAATFTRAHDAGLTGRERPARFSVRTNITLAPAIRSGSKIRCATNPFPISQVGHAL